ncbi:MAG: hypothetical protein HDT38_02440 [Clostridiales bacterium]|nr:hypothetical protein [Clostridiales bacterium]
MKESTLATKIMIAILCLGVGVYLAVYFVRGWKEELATTPAYAFSLDVGAEATGILVRTEVPLNGSGGYVDQILAEGAKAAVGDAVALLYSDPSALTTRQSIRSLEAEIQQLQYALGSGTQNTDAARLDAQVINSIVALRTLAAGGDLTTLEDSALNLRAMVFKRDYTYGDTNAAGQLSQLIADKQSQLAQLNHSLNQVSTTVYAPVSGVYSAGADGWEGVVSPAMLDGLTADGLDDLLHQQYSPSPNAVGKLVTGSTWYFAALLDGTDTGLQSGRKYTLSFSGDYYGQVEMTLDRVSLEGERTLAVFSCRSHLADTAMLRIQTVDVVTRQIEGIRIPRKALRVVTEDVTDDDGAVSRVNRYGVFTVVSSQAEWQAVEVLYTDDTYYLVRPVNQDASKRLRAGDEVILNSSGIYDGKVVR